MAGQLKNIRFLNCSATVLSIEHLSRVHISWQLEPTAQNLSSLRFFVDRGESPVELKQVSNEILPNTRYEWVDETAQLRDFEKIYYYRVRAVELVSGCPAQTFYSEVFTWEGKPDLVALYVVEEHLFAHRFVYGIPTMIYQKRHDGIYCPECWDEVMKRSTKSSCKTCFGTGKQQGYYPPIEAWAALEPDPKTVDIADWGKRQPGQTDMQFTNYPILRTDDLVVELKPNILWKVVNVRMAEKNRTIMLQVCRLSAVNRSDIEHAIQIPEDRRLALVAQLEEREKEREF